MDPKKKNVVKPVDPTGVDRRNKPVDPICNACGVDRRTKPDKKCDCWGY
jgi:hypothetical protein